MNFDFFGKVLNPNPCSFFIINDKGDIRFVNDAMTFLSGFERNELVGKAVDEFFEYGLNSHFSSVLDYCLSTEEQNFIIDIDQQLSLLLRSKSKTIVELHVGSFHESGRKYFVFMIYDKKFQLGVLKTLAASYNHNINNPLTIALYYAGKIAQNNILTADVNKLQHSLKRIEKFTKSIANTRTIEHELYGGGVNVYDVEKMNICTKVIVHVEKCKKFLDLTSLISRVDVQGVLTYVNDKFCDVSGYSQQELLGIDEDVLNSGWHDEDYWFRLKKSLSEREMWKGEICKRAKNGNLFWVEANIIQDLDSCGFVSGYYSIMMDITERKEREFSYENQLADLKTRSLSGKS